MILFVLGMMLAMIIDIVWWKIDFKKAEKGLEAHEHYHIGLELSIVYLITGWDFLLGLGLGFFMAEWSQHIEIHRRKVVPGHPFAYGSKHFKESTIIGVILAIILVATYIII